MTRTQALVLVLGALVPLAAATWASAQRLEVEADEVSYEKGDSIVRAHGGVVATWKDNKLTAESVSYNRDQNRLVADGGLVFDAPEIVVRAQSCDLYLEAETGVLRDVTVEVKDRPGSFGGEVVRKNSGRSYSLDGGRYTACMRSEEHEPDWELSGEDVDIELDGYSTVRRGRLRVRGVPILYLPYAKFPTRFRRTSGVLMPSVGISSERGFVYEQPYFWAIDKQSDATIVAAVETSRRLGLGGEYRYRFDRGIDGRLELQYFNEAIRSGGSNIDSPLFDPSVTNSSIPENRFLLALHHRQDVIGNVRLYSDILAVTDRFYLQEIDSNANGYFDKATRKSLRYTDSNLGVMSNTRDNSYGVDTTLYQLLARDPGRNADGNEDDRIVQRPFDAWASTDGTLGGLLNYNVEGTVDAFLREEGADGQRVDLAATLDRNILATRPLRSSAWLRGRFTGYHNTDRSLRDNTGNLLRDLSRWAGRGAFEAGLDLRSGFARTYQLRGPAQESDDGDRGYSAMQHTLEPFGRMRFTDRTSEEDLPLYDGVDRIDDRTTATYGILSRFLFLRRGEAGPSELARVSLEQTYNLSEQVLDDHLSDIDATLQMVPSERISFSGITSYNVGANSLRGAMAAVTWNRFTVPGTRKNGSRIDAVYRFVRGNTVDFAPPTVPDTPPEGFEALDGLENLEARGIIGITDVLAAGFYGRYDFVGSRFVEKGGGIRLSSKCDCWNIEIGVVDRVSPDELQVRVQVELKGLAQVGSSALMRSSPGLALFDRGLYDARRYGW